MELAQEVYRGPRSELLLELVLGNPGCITAAIPQAVRPLIEGGAIAAVAEVAEAGGSGRRSGHVARRRGSRSICARARPVGVQVGIAGRV